MLWWPKPALLGAAPRAIAAVAVLGLTLPAAPARAIPVFARIYDKPCGACHTVFPQLNPGRSSSRTSPTSSGRR